MAVEGNSMIVDWIDAVEDIAIDLELADRSLPRDLDLPWATG